MDTHQSSCAKCSKALPVGIPSGLCVECSGTHRSAGTVARVLSSVASRIRGAFRLLRKRVGLTPREAPRTEDAVTVTLPAVLGRNPVPPSGAVTKSLPPAAVEGSTGSIHASDALRAFGLTSTGEYSDKLDNAPTADPPPHPPLTMPPHPPGYELVGEISRGGMGVVYLAFERACPDQMVAIKYLMDSADATAFKRFEVEMRLSRLGSKHVAKVLTSNPDAARPYLVMELAGGGTLAGRVRYDGPLDPLLAARWVRDVALAVAEAHEKHVIHRDIKPGNILLAREDRQDAKYVRLHGQQKAGEPFRAADYYPKLSDFGLAKRLGGGTGVTVGSAAMGTAPYMPPEQVRNPQAGEEDERVGVRSDVYSLGATLYHLVCGRAPFAGESAAAVMLDVMHREPPLPRTVRPELPWQLEAIIVKAMEKKPRNRYQTAKDLADDLAAFIDRKDIRARRLTRLRRAWRAVGRNAAAVAAVVVAAGLFTAGAVWASTRQQHSPTSEEPAPDPTAELQRLIAAGPVNLVDDSRLDAAGMPRGARWRFAPGTLGRSPTPDRAFMFQAETLTLLELVSNPALDCYRVSVQLRQMTPKGGIETVGVYLGHAETRTTTGRPVHTLFANRFTDALVRDFPHLPRHAEFGGLIVTEQPDLLPGTHVPPNPKVRFEPSAVPPGKWRRVQIDVTPERLRCVWMDEKKPPAPFKGAEGGPRVEYSRLQLKADADSVGFTVPDWSPRMPLGVWCRGTSVAVESFIIGPLPNP